MSRYLVTGVLLAISSLVVFSLANQFMGFHYIASNLLAFAMVLPIAFYLQRNWVFRSKSKHAMIRFIILQFSSVAIGAFLIIIFVEAINFPPLLAQASVVIVNSSLRFLVSNRFVFN